MTYFGFHLRFLLPPIAFLAALVCAAWRQGKRRPANASWAAAGFALAAHVAVAVAYTTPWDNYLVANRVWWYDPGRVVGVTIGRVPIEEYAFFVLQTVLTGLWVIWLATRLHPARAARVPGWLSPTAAMIAGLPWLAALAILMARWTPGTYLALELVWLLPPAWPQLALGIHALWQRRGLVVLGLAAPVLYLSLADAVAIRSGIWTINPGRTTGLLLGGVLPLEELVFFVLTNTLIVFGMTLLMARPLPAWVGTSVQPRLRSDR